MPSQTRADVVLPLDELDLGADSVLARIRPYRAVASPGGTVAFLVEVRNPLSQSAAVQVVPVLPCGWTARPLPPHVLAPGASTEVLFTATVGGLLGVNRRVAVDLTVGSRRRGQHAEATVDVVGEEHPGRPASTDAFRGSGVDAAARPADASGTVRHPPGRCGLEGRPDLEPTESPCV